MFDFNGKTVVITGASQGIGAALAQAVAAEGGNLSLLARDDAAVHRVALDAKKTYGVDTIARACDIRDAHRVSAVVDETVRMFGHIDAVINNAATLGEMAPLYQCDPEKWRNTVEVNLNGTFNVIRYTTAAMQRRGGGRVVIVSSSVGRTPRPNWGAYSISKYAVEGLVKLLAAESAETNVICCSVNPGGTATGMRREAFPDEDQSILPTPQQVARGIVKVMRQPEELFNGKALDIRDYL
jgi:NAD(P)-dependent dehydrogenase (short-subunit alcohol dehydrogenase family)